MTSEEEKYKRVLAIIRGLKPDLKDIDRISENVTGRIRRGESDQEQIPGLVENLFSWIYIGWVRKSLVTGSVLLVMFFAYQQTMILKGVNDINRREIVTGQGTFSGTFDDLEKQLRMMRLTGRGFPGEGVKITEEQAEQLIESYNELQDKYIDLIRIIEQDTVLSKYINEKLGENKNKTPNL